MLDLFIKSINDYYSNEFGNYAPVLTLSDDLTAVGLAYTEFYEGDTEYNNSNVDSVQVTANLITRTITHTLTQPRGEREAVYVEHYTDTEFLEVLQVYDFCGYIYSYI